MNYQELISQKIFIAPETRRRLLIDEMNQLKAIKQGCENCPGFCCTYQYNSMQVTPLQALDTYIYLKENNLIDEDLIQRLKDCIKEFRLDKEMMLRRGTTFRRSYTCPFYRHQAKGCSIPPEYKPYGCLGFNALKEAVSTEGECTSNIDLLEKREIEFSSEEALSQEIKEKLGLWWEKQSYPMAVLDLINLLK